MYDHWPCYSFRCTWFMSSSRSTSCETGQKISTKACSICFWSSWKHFFLYFQQMYVYCLYIPFPLIFPDHWRCLICQCFNIVPWKPISLQIFVNCVPSSQKLFFAKKTGPERCKKALRFCQVTRTVCFSIPPWEKKSDFIYWFPLELLYFPSENNIFAIYSQLSLIFLSIATSILFKNNWQHK